MSEIKKKNTKDCTAFCPVCGSDVCFSTDGCYCKGSFKKDSTCNWVCQNCSPRSSVAR